MTNSTESENSGYSRFSQSERIAPAENTAAPKSLKRNTLLNSIRSVAGLLFPLITFPYVSRVLEPESIGRVNFAQSVVSYFGMIAALGIGSYAVREAAKVRDNKIALSKFAKEILTINLTSTLIAYCLMAFALLFIGQLHEYATLVIVCSGTILFTTLGIDWLYSSLEEFSYITVRSLIFQAVSMTLLFTLVRDSDDVLQYAAVSVLSSVGSNVCNFLHARKYIDFSVKIKKEIKKHLKPIFTLFAMSATVSIYTALDTTMLGFLAGDREVGLYSAATKINKLVLSLITAANGVLLPRFAWYAAQKQNESFTATANKAFAFTTMLGLPSAAGLCILAEPVVRLLSGERFLPAVPTMQIMNPIIVVIALSGLVGVQIFMALGKERLTLVSVAFGAVLNFTMNMILIPKYGAFGAGVATLCAECTVTAVQLVMGRKYFLWKELAPHLVQCSVATAAMAACVFLVEKFVPSSLIKIVAGIFCGVFVYAAFLLILRNRFFTDLLKRNKNKGGQNES